MSADAINNASAINNELKKKLQAEYNEKMTKLEALKKDNLVYFFQPLASSRREMPYQQMPFDMFDAGKNVVLFPAPNKVGKTAMAACMIISWCMGFEPWNRLEDGTYKKSCLGKEPPVRIRITGEDWTHSIGQTIVPELKKWAPVGRYHTRKNSQGVEYLWLWDNGSTIEIMTHDQDVKLFESWLGDGWWPDEPPPYKIWSAMSRGLFTTGGKVLIPTTPLREAWMLDELVLKGRKDVGLILDVNIWDNPLLYESDRRALLDAGLTEGDVARYFNASMEFKNENNAELMKILKERMEDAPAEALFEETIKRIKIQRFIDDLPEEERRPRLFGEFASLVGRVLKDYDPNIHDIEPFTVPSDWPVTVGIDFHLSKEQAVSFYAVDKVGQNYVIDEIWEHISPEQIADNIIRRKIKNGWRISKAFIDPLARGDNKFVRNRDGNAVDAFTIIRKKLLPHGILLEVASKDKNSGIQNIMSMLKGPNKRPILYFFNSLVRHKYELFRWVYDDKGKPAKENDDMMENLYRYTLYGVKYTEPGAFRKSPEINLGVI